MRAIFQSDLAFNEGDVLTITGEEAHHLFVVRARPEELVLLLNGEGKTLEAVILESGKTEYKLAVKKAIVHERTHNISLAIALPKKDAFEDILKMATELGVVKIFPLKSVYSQFEYSPHERYERLIKSALVQSNNPYFPVIEEEMVELQSFVKEHQNSIYFFNSKEVINQKSLHRAEDITLLIGPEGGFSKEEENFLLSCPNLVPLHLPTPILRAPTAVAAAIGHMLNTH